MTLRAKDLAPHREFPPPDATVLALLHVEQGAQALVSSSRCSWRAADSRCRVAGGAGGYFRFQGDDTGEVIAAVAESLHGA